MTNNQKKKKKKHKKAKEKKIMSNVHLNQKKKKKKKRRRRQHPRGRKKKQWRREMYEQSSCASAQKHFCPLSSLIFSLQFSLHSGEKKFLVRPGRKHMDPTIYFPSFPPNQTNSKKVFLLIFSSKFSLHPISHPNKHTLKV